MSSSGTGSREESFGATLSHTMRQRLIAALILAVLLEGTGRFLARHESFEPVVGHLLSIFAATLAGATVVLLVSRTCRGRTIPTIMIVAALALVTSTILHTTGSLSAFDDIPILGNRADYHRVTISIADIFGIAAWIFGFFGLVFEIHHAKTSLSLQHELLLAETRERERTERALKQSEALFREVFEEADAGIVVLDPEATILQCNGTFCEELGLPTGAPTKTNIKDLMSADHAAKLGGTIDKLSPHHGHTHRDEYNFRHRKGHPLIFDVALTAIKPIAGNRATVMAIVENRTEEREREDQVLQQQKLESIGNLAGGIAHDFNNLFVAIMANAELLGQNVRRGPEDAAICSDIVAATQRAAKLCEQLLAYAGKAPMAEQPLNLSTLIRDSRSLLKMAVSRNATLQFTCDEGLPAILADPSQIRQLILNLLTNASEALAGESGELNVATSEVNLGKVDVVAFSDTLPPPKPGNYVCVSVSDTGTGVTSSTIGKLFEPFYTTKGMATGLGLAAVQGIVRAHRGVLAVESSPDDGTTVRVLFPVATKGMQSAPSVPRNALTPLPTPPTGGTVLLVDDEELVADAARRILELSGYAVITASNGLEGVDVFRERYKNLTVVLLDLTMPVMDGVEASAEMHAICPDVPIILSSGFSEAEAQKSGVKAIAAGYLRKPYRVRELLDTIENVLTP